MAFTRASANPPKPRSVRARAVVRFVGTLGIAALLCLAALIPYDRLTPEPQGGSDLVPLEPSDPPVHTIADLNRVYGISAAAEDHFRVDKRGVHYLRERTAEDEERK
jgi:hypothetical protein